MIPTGFQFGRRDSEADSRRGSEGTAEVGVKEVSQGGGGWAMEGFVGEEE